MENQDFNSRFNKALRQYGGSQGNDMAIAREKSQTQAEENILNLYMEKITWGEYSRRRKELAVQLRDQLNEITNPKK